MQRSLRSLVFALGALGASCSAVPRPAARPPLVRRAASAPPATPDGRAAPAAPTAAAPSAADRVRTALEGAPVLAAEDAAWMRYRVLEAIVRLTGELPASTAPVIRDDAVVWSLVGPARPGGEGEGYASVCDEVTRAEPRVLCAADAVDVGATRRARAAFGWRRAAGEAAADLGTPLRALARAGTGACLLAAQRTLRTVELRIQAPGLRALGTTLALLAAAPRLADLIMIDADRPASQDAAVSARLSWPTDRADRTRGSLGPDPWPPRCGDRAVAAQDAPPAARLLPLLALGGERARGAVVAYAGREWIVTEGDQVGDATVARIVPDGIEVRRGSSRRGTVVRFARATPAGAASAASSSPRATVRLPTPPEPPAVPSTP